LNNPMKGAFQRRPRAAYNEIHTHTHTHTHTLTQAYLCSLN